MEDKANQSSSGEPNHNEFPLIESETCWRERLSVSDAIDDPHFSEIFHFWKGRCQAGGLPGVQEMDPVELPRTVLPFIILLDVCENPTRFRYRLTGTKIDQVQNRNISGTYVDEHNPKELREFLTEDLLEMMETAEPHFCRVVFKNVTGHLRNVAALRLPLAEETGQRKVFRVLVILQFPEE